MKILFIVDIYEKHIVKTKIQKEMLKKYKKHKSSGKIH